MPVPHSLPGPEACVCLHEHTCRGRNRPQDDAQGGQNAESTAAGEHCEPEGGVSAQAEAGKGLVFRLLRHHLPTCQIVARVYRTSEPLCTLQSVESCSSTTAHTFPLWCIYQVNGTLQLAPRFPACCAPAQYSLHKRVGHGHACTVSDRGHLLRVQLWLHCSALLLGDG